MLFNYLNVFCIIYLNNIIIYFNNLLKYKVYIKKVLARLQKHNLLINIRKSKFHIKKIKFLKFFVIIKRIKIDLIITEYVRD